MIDKTCLVDIRQASIWASNFLKKNVTQSNITYLIQYGRIKKYGNNGSSFVSLHDLERYYRETNVKMVENHNNNVDWLLAFDNTSESDRTKHVHRLHPYKGKFIPQLVEYFIDSHTDKLKQKVFFNKGDLVIDPFCGCGTTLVVCSELGIDCIGIDISEFNSVISNCKLNNYDYTTLNQWINNISFDLNEHYRNSLYKKFDDEITNALLIFNNKYFETPSYKEAVHSKQINEFIYAIDKENMFIKYYNTIFEKYKFNYLIDVNTFIGKWFNPNMIDEINIVKQNINNAPYEIKDILKIILSRTVRSCRATKHVDLATLIEPVFTPYYCTKHFKICKPLVSINKWWNTYSKDTVSRLMIFSKLKTNSEQLCITGNSVKINLLNAIKNKSDKLFYHLLNEKADGIFTSPPYVGLIDYHEQHAYAYELFEIPRNDKSEIGSLSNGQTIEARNKYINEVSSVFINMSNYLKSDADIFIVANDKFKIYPLIAEKANLDIIKEYHRPVLNRTEKDKNAYSETIFHMKRKNG